MESILVAWRPLAFAQHFIVCNVYLRRWELSGCTYMVATGESQRLLCVFPVQP